MTAHFQRSPFCVLALSLTAAACLVACGGGGSDTTPTANPVYAEPSGTLCATRDASNVCNEPTSSAVTTDQLLALQQNATGEQVHFNALGVQNDIYQQFASVASGLGVTTSSSTYTLLEQPILLGRNQVTEGSVTYAFDSTSGAATLKYASGKNTVALSSGTGAGTPFALRRDTIYAESGSVDGSGTRGLKDWPAFFGPLTDRVDAPAEVDITYVGAVGIRAGDGSPVVINGLGTLGHVAWGGCAITLTLHTSTGTLTTTDAKCTDAQTQAVITFTLAPLYFKASRVAGQSGGEASIDIDAPSGGLVSVPGIEHTKVQTRSSSISGAMYGRAAAGIAVVGSSAQGTFQIVAHRQ